jgi:hypothetical protein
MTGAIVLRFTFTHAAGAIRTILAAPEIGLALSDWAILGEAEQGASGEYHFTDVQATVAPQRFYRILVAPKGSF